MERIGHIAKSWQEADDWDRAQYAAMTPDERRAVLARLKQRLMGPDWQDLRECREARIVRPDDR